MTANRTRLTGALILVLAALALTVWGVVRIRDHRATPPPTVSSAPSTQTGSSSTMTPTTLSQEQIAAAKRIVTASPILAQVAGTTPWSIGTVAPLEGIVTSDPFLGASVEVHFADPVAFPAGIPILRTLPEGHAPLPLSEMIVSSEDRGQRVEAITALVNILDNRVVAVLPGP